jgi:hypothetical protein
VVTDDVGLMLEIESSLRAAELDFVNQIFAVDMFGLAHCLLKLRGHFLHRGIRFEALTVARIHESNLGSFELQLVLPSRNLHRPEHCRGSECHIVSFGTRDRQPGHGEQQNKFSHAL